MTSLHPPSFQRNDFSTCSSSEIWEANTAQAAALKSLVLRGAKHTLGSSRTCNGTIRWDMGFSSGS